MFDGSKEQNRFMMSGIWFKLLYIINILWSYLEKTICKFLFQTRMSSEKVAKTQWIVIKCNILFLCLVDLTNQSKHSQYLHELLIAQS